MTKQEFFNKFKSVFLWGNLVAMLLVVIIALLVLQICLRSCTHHGEKIVVPNLSGITIEQAQRALDALKLHIEVSDTAYEDGMPRGTIVRQTPVGGHAVKEGRCIYVTVNAMDALPVEIPDVVNNMSYQEARMTLEGKKFVLTEPKYISGEEDWVYDLLWNGRHVESGDKLPKGSRLTLVVGNGNADDDDEEQQDDVEEAVLVDDDFGAE